MQKISIYIFEEHIADMYQVQELKQKHILHEVSKRTLKGVLQ
ncbi:hypothetical protein [Arcobacter sp. FWKO B]|nr:hypothetical protein [Arcobacter sp. FWKO B]